MFSGIFINFSHQNKLFRSILSIIIAFSWVSSSTLSHSQTISTPLVPQPGTMMTLSEAFHPAVIRGIELNTENPFLIDFIVDTGDSGLSGETLTAETTKLAKYFLAGMAVPDEDLWVNLSPYETERIIEEEFGQTDMGRDLLAQDYLLKQITASLIYPEDDTGKQFWKTIYERAYAQYGVTDIPVDTFNKVWITPAKIVVYQNGPKAYVKESTLKVQLEKDFLAERNSDTVPGSQRLNDSDNNISADVMREVIIPVLEHEVNHGENFAPLRQIVFSMALADWYKQSLKQSLLTQLYADQNKVTGIDQSPQQDPQTTYQQYIEAYKKGVYNYIKEEVDVYSGETIPRRYFSGGFFKDYEMEVRDGEFGEEDVDGRAQRMPFALEVRDTVTFNSLDEVQRYLTNELSPFINDFENSDFDSLFFDDINALNEIRSVLQGILGNDNLKPVHTQTEDYITRIEELLMDRGMAASGEEQPGARGVILPETMITQVTTAFFNASKAKSASNGLDIYLNDQGKDRFLLHVDLKNDRESSRREATRVLNNYIIDEGPVVSFDTHIKAGRLTLYVTYQHQSNQTTVTPVSRFRTQRRMPPWQGVRGNPNRIRPEDRGMVADFDTLKGVIEERWRDFAERQRLDESTDAQPFTLQPFDTNLNSGVTVMARTAFNGNTADQTTAKEEIQLIRQFLNDSVVPYLKTTYNIEPQLSDSKIVVSSQEVTVDGEQQEASELDKDAGSSIPTNFKEFIAGTRKANGMRNINLRHRYVTLTWSKFQSEPNKDQSMVGARDVHEQVHLPWLNQLIDKAGRERIETLIARGQDIDDVVNEVNVSAQFEALAAEGRLEGVNPTTPEALKQDPNVDFEVYRNQAELMLLNGDYVMDDLFAGKATRLNRGGMYGVDLWDILVEEDVVPEGKRSEFSFGMGPRQLIAFYMFLKRLADEHGRDFQEVLANQTIVMRLNDEVESVALNDLKTNHFYGFSRANFYFINQPEYRGYALRDGELVLDEESTPLVYGHGDNFMQLNQAGVVYQIDLQGQKVMLEKSMLDLLGSKQLASHRVNDLTKFSAATVVDLDILAVGLYLQQEQGVDIVPELVANPNKQKGGTATPFGLVETLAVKGSDHLKNVVARFGEQGMPYNAFRILYPSATRLKEMMEENELPYYLRFKDDRFYLEAVTGDITFRADGKQAYAQIPDREIADFKELKDAASALPYLQDQDADMRDLGIHPNYFAELGVDQQMAASSDENLLENLNPTQLKEALLDTIPDERGDDGRRTKESIFIRYKRNTTHRNANYINSGPISGSMDAFVTRLVDKTILKEKPGDDKRFSLEVNGLQFVITDTSMRASVDSFYSQTTLIPGEQLEYWLKGAMEDAYAENGQQVVVQVLGETVQTLNLSDNPIFRSGYLRTVAKSLSEQIAQRFMTNPEQLSVKAEVNGNIVMISNLLISVYGASRDTWMATQQDQQQLPRFHYASTDPDLKTAIMSALDDPRDNTSKTITVSKGLTTVSFEYRPDNLDESASASLDQQLNSLSLRTMFGVDMLFLPNGDIILSDHAIESREQSSKIVSVNAESMRFETGLIFPVAFDLQVNGKVIHFELTQNSKEGIERAFLSQDFNTYHWANYWIKRVNTQGDQIGSARRYSVQLQVVFKEENIPPTIRYIDVNNISSLTGITEEDFQLVKEVFSNVRQWDANSILTDLSMEASEHPQSFFTQPQLVSGEHIEEWLEKAIDQIKRTSGKFNEVIVHAPDGDAHFVYPAQFSDDILMRGIEGKGYLNDVMMALIEHDVEIDTDRVLFHVYVEGNTIHIDEQSYVLSDDKPTAIYQEETGLPRFWGSFDFDDLVVFAQTTSGSSEEVKVYYKGILLNQRLLMDPQKERVIQSVRNIFNQLKSGDDLFYLLDATQRQEEKAIYIEDYSMETTETTYKGSNLRYPISSMLQQDDLSGRRIYFKGKSVKIIPNFNTINDREIFIGRVLEGMRSLFQGEDFNQSEFTVTLHENGIHVDEALRVQANTDVPQVITHGGIYLGDDFIEIQGVDERGLPMFDPTLLIRFQQDFQGLTPVPLTGPQPMVLPLYSRVFDEPANESVPEGSEPSDHRMDLADRRRS